jgi:class 3 adenylate cyclase
MERKFAAILCADVAGYSRLMGENEEATLRTLTAHRKIIDRLIEDRRRRFVNSAGDSVLSEFASVLEAVNCAVDIQNALKAENQNLPQARRMEFRIGVNLGDVRVEGEQIYGDGVNVAARLESLADPAGICMAKFTRRSEANSLSSTMIWASNRSKTLSNRCVLCECYWTPPRTFLEGRTEWHAAIGAAAHSLWQVSW